jgi:UDP-3-O-[3-hydroxymyristoyl] N-acetylglucosamine deacetylase
MQQHTFGEKVEIGGIGLHSGLPSKMVFHPAPANHGIIFKRVDLPSQPEIKALYSNVIDTRNCTCLGDAAKNSVSTIEHLMSVLYILEIDNVLIEIDNPELPIMDGSAKITLNMLGRAPIVEQAEKRKYLKVKKEVFFADDKGNKAILKPYANGLKINFEIFFPSKIVGRQVFDGEINKYVFENEIAQCRTFCEKYQVDYLQSIGLIKGGSLANAVVLDGDTILNDGGLYHEKECVNHKVLDAIGDLYTSGYPVVGELIASKTGHYHNNELLKVLFSNKSNYGLV